MTVKELFLSVSFDELLPFLEKWESDHLDNIYAFREAYDILRNMKTNIDYHGEVIISCNKENDDQSIEIIRSDDDVWENELAKEVIFKDVNQTDIREIAMQCLWEMTFYGFSPTERNNTFDKMFNGHKPTLRYEIALDRLEESIWKHQTPRRLRHKDKYGRRLTTWDDSRKFLFERRMNRSKRKRDFRRLWITRISAAAQLNGMNYSTFMNGLKKANVGLNRKMLAEIAVADPAAFAALVETAKSAL